jgi:AraC-like DNA-binding protein
MADIHPKLFYFVQKECTPTWSIRKHVLDYYYSLVFILQGSAEYLINDVKYHAVAGDVVFVRRGSTRSATTEGMHCVALDFTLPDGEDVSLPTIIHYDDIKQFSYLFQELKFEWLQQREGYQLKCQGLFALILHKLVYERENNQNIAFLSIIKRYIIEHSGQKLTIAELAKLVHLSPVYCGALFKNIEGITINEFIKQVRMNKASALLRTGEYTISETAEIVGFKDVFYFSNTFKKYFGISPNYYRHSFHL